jgi:hypothetical protein
VHRRIRGLRVRGSGCVRCVWQILKHHSSVLQDEARIVSLTTKDMLFCEDVGDD